MKSCRLILIMAVLCLALSGCSGGSDTPAQALEDLTVVGFSQVGAESDWRNGNTRSMQEAFPPGTATA